MDTPKLHEAIIYASNAHHGQVRKGTEIPYIVHPMEVLQILTEMGMPEEVLIAGVLHDIVEDTQVTLEDLREKFGERVAWLVGAHTQDKSLDWQERKEHGLEQFRNGPKDVRAIILADKISNLRSLYYDHNQMGDEIWTRFHAPKERQAWYYGTAIEILENFTDFEEGRAYCGELAELFAGTFLLSRLHSPGQWDTPRDRRNVPTQR